MSQAITAANPITQKSGSKGSMPSPARVAADNGVTISPAGAEDFAAGASIGFATRAPLVAVAPSSTNPIEPDKVFDRREAAGNPASFAEDSVAENARGSTGTFQFGDIHIASGSSALMRRVAYRMR
jgi:hypothetical protein